MKSKEGRKRTTEAKAEVLRHLKLVREEISDQIRRLKGEVEIGEEAMTIRIKSAEDQIAKKNPYSITKQHSRDIKSLTDTLSNLSDDVSKINTEQLRKEVTANLANELISNNEKGLQHALSKTFSNTMTESLSATQEEINSLAESIEELKESASKKDKDATNHNENLGPEIGMFLKLNLQRRIDDGLEHARLRRDAERHEITSFEINKFTHKLRLLQATIPNHWKEGWKSRIQDQVEEAIAY